MHINYDKTPLPSKDLALLGNRFLGFTELWPITLRLIRKDFVRSALKPSLWSLLIILVSYLIIATIIVVGAIVLGVGTFGLSESSDVFAEYSTGMLILLILLAIVIISAFVIWFIYITLNLTVRQYTLLNNTDYSSIWNLANNKQLHKTMGFFLLTSFLIGILAQIIGFALFPVSLVVSLIGLINSFMYGLSLFVSSIVSLIPTFIVSSAFGYAIFTTIFDRENPIDALKSAFAITKPYYLKNIIRWIPIQIPTIVLLGIYSVFMGLMFQTDESLSGAESSVFTDSPLFTNLMDNTLNMPLLLSIVGIVVSILFVIGIVLFGIFVFYYQYVTYLNLRLISKKA